MHKPEPASAQSTQWPTDHDLVCQLAEEGEKEIRIHTFGEHRSNRSGQEIQQASNDAAASSQRFASVDEDSPQSVPRRQRPHEICESPAAGLCESVLTVTG